MSRRRRRHRAAAGAVRRVVTGIHHLVVVVASRLEGGAAARTLLPLPQQRLQPTAPALGSPHYLRVSVAPQPTHLCCCLSLETFSASKIFAFFARRVTPSVLRIVFGLCVSPGGGRRSPAVGGGGGARERGKSPLASSKGKEPDWQTLRSSANNTATKPKEKVSLPDCLPARPPARLPAYCTR